MKYLMQDITKEIDKRSNELSSIIKKASQLNDKYLNKFFLVAIYANWEAFIKNLIGYYIDYLYTYDLLKNIYFISLIIKHEKLFERNLTDIKQIKDILKKINHIKTKPYLKLDKIKFKIMNFDNTNKLLRQFKLPEFDKENRGRLNTLVEHRNWIAHGKEAICLDNITIAEIREYSNLIENMMNECLLNINSTNILKNI